MAPLVPKQQSLKDIDFAYYFEHYVRLFWRAKWFILSCFIVVNAAGLYYVLNHAGAREKLSATIVIGLDNARQSSAVREISTDGANKARVMQSRRFLSSVIDSLSLRFVLNTFTREQVFDSLWIDTTAALGKYLFEISDELDEYSIYYSNPSIGFDQKLVKRGRVLTLDTLLLPGIALNFTQDYLKEPFRFEFSIITMRAAIARMRENLVVRGPAGSDVQFSVTLSGDDYSLITNTANTMADMFVTQNLGFRNTRTQDALNILQKQLAQASEELESSKQQLLRFLTANPKVGLTNRTAQTLGDLSAVEVDGYRVEKVKEQGELLQKNFREAAPENRFLVVQEMLAMLHTNEVAQATVLREQLQTAMAEQDVLLQRYAQNHPRIIESKKAIVTLEQQAFEALSRYLSSMQAQVQRRQQTTQSLQTQLSGLPLKEMQLTELQRKHDINTTMYSAILSRYNEMRIANVVEVSDVYVLDYAVVPIPLPEYMRKIRNFAIVLLLSLLVGIGPVIGLDLIDKSVRSEQELAKLLSYPLLEAIPTIRLPKKLREAPKSPDGKRQRRIDPYLVAAEPEPNFIIEIFRSLRTKLLFVFHDVSPLSMAFTSLNMAEGKSTLSGNVAIVLAKQGLRTVLIDVDLRKGVQHHSFMLQKEPGLSNFLVAEIAVDKHSVLELAQATHIEKLSVISCGAHVPNPQELLATQRFARLRQVLEELYDVIIFDTPPLGVATDALALDKWVHRFVLVARAGKTNIVDLRKKIEEFPQIKDKIAGVILNQAALSRRMKYYKYSKYYG
jgi:tyrosine-protein kinase Etk/Wzc